MEQTSRRILLLLSLSATFAKYVYINEGKSWTNAQGYCREHYTDLAPVSHEYDFKRVQLVPGTTAKYLWIGLVRNSTDHEKWTWSGGGQVSTFFWNENQPGNGPEDGHGQIRDNKWHNAMGTDESTFLCYKAVVVRVRKTWEEALEHCREHHGDLASVASDTETLLMRKELGKDKTTARVWTGLRFLAGDWLWVDRQPLSYEAWGPGGRPECPQVSRKCGVLRVTGGEQIDNAAVEPMGNYSDTGNDGEWEAFDCAERLHFICY
uniref:C-type lectin domain-containing protein n=1 Tax=Gasterosteus aculeatus aculeatus TaxID=481459 RepID=A0AAQ4Q4W8_GASAC|nr:C-type mannose receptor 2-like [Gasterosteus aculeatus aculeatus]